MYPCVYLVCHVCTYLKTKTKNPELSFQTLLYLRTAFFTFGIPFSLNTCSFLLSLLIYHNGLVYYSCPNWYISYTYVDCRIADICFLLSMFSILSQFNFYELCPCWFSCSTQSCSVPLYRVFICVCVFCLEYNNCHFKCCIHLS